MKRSVKVLDAAVEEAAEAAAWYERQREGLGIEFLKAVDVALDLLEDEFVPLTPVPGFAGKRGAKGWRLAEGVGCSIPIVRL